MLRLELREKRTDLGGELFGRAGGLSDGAAVWPLPLLVKARLKCLKEG